MVNIPIFIILTDGLDQNQKTKVTKSATLVTFIIIVAFILVGKYIFEIFRLTIPGFKVFGGIMMFFIVFEMLQLEKPSIKNHLLKV